MKSPNCWQSQPNEDLVQWADAVFKSGPLLFSGGTSFFFEGKRVSRKKLISILGNNVPKSATVRVTLKKVEQPFYKGDYTYFQNRYGARGWSRAVRGKYYFALVK